VDTEQSATAPLVHVLQAAAHGEHVLPERKKPALHPVQIAGSEQVLQLETWHVPSTTPTHAIAATTAHSSTDFVVARIAFLTLSLRPLPLPRTLQVFPSNLFFLT